MAEVKHEAEVEALIQCPTVRASKLIKVAEYSSRATKVLQRHSDLVGLLP